MAEKETLGGELRQLLLVPWAPLALPWLLLQWSPLPRSCGAGGGGVPGGSLSPQLGNQLESGKVEAVPLGALESQAGRFQPEFVSSPSAPGVPTGLRASVMSPGGTP